MTRATKWYHAWENYASPDNFCTDAMALLRYMRGQMGLRGKIGVYGRSLGGIAATCMSRYVDMAIVDRSFANLHDVANRKFHGESATTIYKMVLPKYRANNDRDFINCEWDTTYCHPDEGCYKVVTCDIADEIVELQSSLMVGVAKQIC